jgi:heme exporter protein D
MAVLLLAVLGVHKVQLMRLMEPVAQEQMRQSRL